jgi:predicted dehydrogenase
MIAATDVAARGLGGSALVRVGVIGAGRWSASAHLPGWVRSPLCRVVAICDLHRDLAEQRAAEFGVGEVTTDYRDLLSRGDIDAIDVCTREEHDPLVFAALEAGKHVLCEKPVAHRAADVWRAAAIARRKGLKTKVGLTFRYAPAMRYMLALVQEGFIGRPFIFNGFEQNSQWLDPDVPADKRIHRVAPAPGDDPVGGRSPRREDIAVHSLEGYGAPIIDIGLMLVGARLSSVVGALKNFVPERRRTNLDTARERINMDDGDIFLGEFENGALGSIQSSFVTVGNYPGIEARIYGERGALICRLVEEFGECQTLHAARPDAVEFRRMDIPARFFPPGYRPGEPWSSLFYANLVHDFAQEIEAGADGKNEGDFAQSARVQEIINAVEVSHRRRAWVDVAREPEAPVGPNEPEGPEGPVGPNEPEGPEGPEEPNEPEGPRGPRGPEGPEAAGA